MRYGLRYKIHFLLPLLLGTFSSLSFTSDFDWAKVSSEEHRTQKFLCDSEAATGSSKAVLLAAKNCYPKLRRRELAISARLSELGFAFKNKSDPEGFARSVLEAEKRYHIDHEVLIALAFVESTFDRFAVSDKGALGMFQMLPPTVLDLWPSFVQTLSPKDPLRFVDPVSKIHDVRLSTLLGAYYLSKLRAQFSGRMHLALASYNVGPGKLRNALQDGQMLAAEYVFRVFDIANSLKGRNI